MVSDLFDWNTSAISSKDTDFYEEDERASVPNGSEGEIKSTKKPCLGQKRKHINGNAISKSTQDQKNIKPIGKRKCSKDDLRDSLSKDKCAPNNIVPRKNKHRKSVTEYMT
jgi:hypothetical protein